MNNDRSTTYNFHERSPKNLPDSTRKDLKIIIEPMMFRDFIKKNYVHIRTSNTMAGILELRVTNFSDCYNLVTRFMEHHFVPY